MKQINDKVQTLIDRSEIKQHTFHNAATMAGDGTPLAVEGGKVLTIEISGTSTGRTIQFFGVSDSETARPLMGINLSTFDAEISTASTGELWQFDVTGLISVMMRVDSVTGGNVTVKGRLVS